MLPADIGVILPTVISEKEEVGVASGVGYAENEFCLGFEVCMKGNPGNWLPPPAGMVGELIG